MTYARADQECGSEAAAATQAGFDGVNRNHYF
jgi:hypothetical protein